MNKNNVLNGAGSKIRSKERKILGKSDNRVARFLKEWIVPLVLAIIFAVLINKFIFFNVYIPSPSMVPTLNVDDKLIVTRVYNKENLKEGDIIVFYSDEYKKRLVKRLIGLPGDKIEIKDGVVFRNGKKLDEDYVKNKDTYNGTYEVPKGEYFFLGDNRSNSADSRYWKETCIEASSIEGKVQFRFYPIKDLGSVK